MGRKQLALRRPDRCSVCGVDLVAGTTAEWDSDLKTVTCLACSVTSAPPPTADARSEPRLVQSTPPVEIDVGVAGASARRQADRRTAQREARIEEKWGSGRMGRIVKALSDDPQTTRAWREGAAGEERVARRLEERLEGQAVLLHDRRVPGTRGNIDHLVIAASGVWIVDAKRYKGKVEKRDKGGWFRTDLHLYVGGRDQTKLVEKMQWQHDAVRAALGSDEVPLHLALTFVDAEWPLFFAKPLRFDDVWVSWPAKLADLIAEPGPLSGDDIERVARELSVRLPAQR